MLSPAEQMSLLRQMWASQAARNDKPSPAWLVITEAGELVGWTLAKPTAIKQAGKRADTCHIAKLDPHDY